MLNDLTDSHGLLLTRDAVAVGIDRRSFYRMARTAGLVRIRQGAFCSGSIWRGASPEEKHRLLSLAVLRMYDDCDVALSHISACVLSGAPTWGFDLRHVHLTGLNGTGQRTAALVKHHRGTVRVDDISRSDGRWVTSPARSVFDAACDAPLVPAVALLDWHLHHGLVTLEQLDSLLLTHSLWPGTLGMHLKLRLANEKSESVGESRTRCLCFQENLPAPEPQYLIRDHTGRVIARVDFAWPEYGLIGEFDGLVKYHRFRRPGETIEEMVLREKEREDLIREITGWTFVRLVWADLGQPVQTAARIRRKLRLQAAA